MAAFVSSLLPVAALILSGYLLKQQRFLPDDAWRGIEKLTYYLLFPALLIHTLGKQSPESAPWSAMLMVIVGVLFISAGLLIVVRLSMKSMVSATFTSVFQGGVRFNTYIALAVAHGLYGAEGLTMATIAAGFMIVLINLMCIVVLLLWGRGAKPGVKPLLSGLVSNPLIIACLLGWLIALSGIELPASADAVLDILGGAALPLGLLAVGAALQPHLIKGHAKAIIIASVVQYLVKPLLTALMVVTVGLNGVSAWVLLISFMSPTATSSYILARQMGGDSETMASIITFQTLLAFIVMPLWAVLIL